MKGEIEEKSLKTKSHESIVAEIIKLRGQTLGITELEIWKLILNLTMILKSEADANQKLRNKLVVWGEF